MYVCSAILMSKYLNWWFGWSVSFDWLVFHLPMLLQSMWILDTFISPSESVKSLGVFMDRDLNINSHISKMLQAGFSAFRPTRSIKKCLFYESLKTFAITSIRNRIDYCNTLLAGLPEKHLCRVHSLINTTVRLITATKKLSKITLVLSQSEGQGCL